MKGYRIALSNSTAMPALGLGTYKTPDGPPVERAVTAALETGYRCVDTASFYGNEAGIGRALAGCAVPRKELFITTKVWNSEQGHGPALEAFERSVEKLGLDYLDLYLIHWPVRGLFMETWRALEELYRREKVKAIGVSNFLVHHLEELLGRCEVPPMVKQVEMHPLFYQKELADYFREKNILVQSWAPLSRGVLFDDPVVTGMAARRGRTPAQVLLRWGLQHGFAVIPKSTDPKRIVSNADVFDFTLTDDEMAALDGLDRRDRLGPDPDNFNF